MASQSAPAPANTTAPITAPVESGLTGMDQSVTSDREPAPRTPNQGNCLPSVPPLSR